MFEAVAAVYLAVLLGQPAGAPAGRSPAAPPHAANMSAAPQATKHTNENPYDAYAHGHFADAFEGFANLQAQHPHDVGLMLNLGASLYRLEDYAGAEKALALAAEHGTPEEREHALYNMGNCAFKQDHLEAAVKHFAGALALNGNDADARHNLAVAQKVLEKRQAEQQKNAGDDAKPPPADPNAPSDTAPKPEPSKNEPSDRDKSGQDPAPDQPSSDNSGDKGTDPNTESAAKPSPTSKQDNATDGDASRPEAAQKPKDGDSQAPPGPGRRKMTRAQAERLLDAMGDTRPRHAAPAEGTAPRPPGGKDY